jgi:hypothetical protein
MISWVAGDVEAAAARVARGALDDVNARAPDGGIRARHHPRAALPRPTDRGGVPARGPREAVPHLVKG